VTKSRSRGREDDLDLSREQNILFTRLERLAVPIVDARHDAVKELGLVDVLHEYAQTERRWAELLNRLDSWILEELRRNRLFAYAVRLPVTPSSVALPVPSGLWHRSSSTSVNAQRPAMIGRSKRFGLCS
jgi:hypothetical protein